MANENEKQPAAESRDTFGRRINYLRVSVTDRCNMRCVYCMPDDVEFLPMSEILTYEELNRAIAAFVSAGVSKVRLTGGEPLARKDIDQLAAQLAKLEGIEELNLTTNGLKLAEHAENLAAAGLDRVNVSLDTLNPEKFTSICRAGRLEDVISGIRAAKKAGLEPVKVNVVVMKGRNDDEIKEFIRFSQDEGVIVRFIEYMPLKMDENWRTLYVSREEMLENAGDLLVEVDRAPSEKNAPARYYQIAGSEDRVGFISPVSHGFCSRCNRMRLTPDGRLLSCLLSENFVDIKSILRSNAPDEDLLQAFKNAVKMKGEKGAFSPSGKPMHKIGG